MYWVGSQEEGGSVAQGQLSPTLETVQATTGDPSRLEAFSVPSRDPREVVAWLRAVVGESES